MFQSTFLTELLSAFENRTKAINHHGKLDWDLDSSANSDFEWFEVTYSSSNSPFVVLRANDQRYIWVRIESKSRRSYGKLLFSVEREIAVENGPLIVSCFEKTVSIARKLEGGTSQARTIRELRKMWNEVLLRVIQS